MIVNISLSYKLLTAVFVGFIKDVSQDIFPFSTGSPYQHDGSETGSVRSVVLILLEQRLIGSLLAPSFFLPSHICDLSDTLQL